MVLASTCSLLCNSAATIRRAVWGYGNFLLSYCPSYPANTSDATSAANEQLTDVAQVSSLLLAPSSKAAGPKGSGPREASTDDLMAAANVLVRSRELLDTLSGKLAAADAPVGCDDTMLH